MLISIIKNIKHIISANPFLFTSLLAGFLLLFSIIAVIFLIILLKKRTEVTISLFEELEKAKQKKDETEEGKISITSTIKPESYLEEDDEKKEIEKTNRELVFLTREYLIREFIEISKQISSLDLNLPLKPVLLNAKDEAKIKGIMEQLEKLHSLAPSYGFIFPVEYYYAKASFHTCRHEINKARLTIQEGLKYYPQETSFMIPLSKFNTILHRENESAEILEKFLEKFPTDPEALRLLILTYIKLENFRRAEELCKILNQTEINPGNRALLAWVLFKEGFISRAEEIIEELKNKSLDEPYINLYTGKIDEEKGLLREALVRFNKCLSKGLKEQILFSSIIKINSFMGRITENKHLMEQIRFYPDLDSEILLIFIEKNNLSWNEISLYETLCKNLIQLRENDPVVFAALALIMIKKNEIALAKENFEKALNIDTVSSPVLLRAIKFYIDEKDYQSASLLLEKGLSLFPSEMEFLILKSEYSKITGSEEEANKISSILLERLQYNPINMEKMGRLLLKLKNYREALNFFTKLEELNIKSATLYNLIGLAYYGLKDYDETLKAWKRALQLDSKNLESLNNLGVLFSLRGSFKIAKKYFSLALQIDPASRQTHYNLARLYTTINHKTAEKHLKRYKELCGE